MQSRFFGIGGAFQHRLRLIFKTTASSVKRQFGCGFEKGGGGETIFLSASPVMPAGNGGENVAAFFG